MSYYSFLDESDIKKYRFDRKGLYIDAIEKTLSNTKLGDRKKANKDYLAKLEGIDKSNKKDDEKTKDKTKAELDYCNGIFNDISGSLTDLRDIE
jgi:hypothetical protein